MILVDLDLAFWCKCQAFLTQFAVLLPEDLSLRDQIFLENPYRFSCYGATWPRFIGSVPAVLCDEQQSVVGPPKLYIRDARSYKQVWALIYRKRVRRFKSIQKMNDFPWQVSRPVYTYVWLCLRVSSVVIQNRYRVSSLNTVDTCIMFNYNI